MVTLAMELIDRKTGPFDPSVFEDRYATALRKLVEKKAKGREVVTTPHADIPRSAEVIDLMEALKKSVSEKSKEAKTTKSSRRSTRKLTRKS